MSALSTPKLVLRRIGNAKFLLISVFIGILFATTLAAAVPIYLASLERLALNIEIDRLGRFQSKLLGFAYYIPLTGSRMAETDHTFDEIVDEYIAEIYTDHRRFVTGLQFYADTPSIPLPPADVANGVRRSSVPAKPVGLPTARDRRRGPPAPAADLDRSRFAGTRSSARRIGGLTVSAAGGGRSPANVGTSQFHRSSQCRSLELWSRPTPMPITGFRPLPSTSVPRPPTPMTRATASTIRRYLPFHYLPTWGRWSRLWTRRSPAH